jgi:hypothetical protein
VEWNPYFDVEYLEKNKCSNFKDCEKMSSELQLCFLNHYLSGSLLTPFLISLALYIFVLSFIVFDLDGCSSLVCIQCTWVASPALFNEFALLIKKIL